MRDCSFQIECRQGDILMLNTSLWWHQTEIPCTKTANDKLSLSYAMDFHVNEGGDGVCTQSSDMTNVNGLFAIKDITDGEIVLTEQDMPDCELPRSDNPTLCLAELDMGGEVMMALVATRDIKKGEWFSIAHDSDSESEDEGDNTNE